MPFAVPVCARYHEVWIVLQRGYVTFIDLTPEQRWGLARALKPLPGQATVCGTAPFLTWMAWFQAISHDGQDSIQNRTCMQRVHLPVPDPRDRLKYCCRNRTGSGYVCERCPPGGEKAKELAAVSVTLESSTLAMNQLNEEVSQARVCRALNETGYSLPLRGTGSFAWATAGLRTQCCSPLKTEQQKCW